MELTQEYLKSRIHYCPETGAFTRLFKKGPKPIRAVHRVPHARSDYIKIRLCGKKFYGHRLAWLYMTGETPTATIDHIDRNGLNNAWGNLRLATRSQQKSNMPARSDNTSGYKGVHLHKKTGKWMATIGHEGERQYLGLYSDVKDAAAAYNEKAKELYGEYAFG